MAADTKPVLEKETVQKDEKANSHQDQGLSEAMVGRLKLASAIMGVLIIICLVALIYGISQKAGNLAKSEEAPATAPLGAPQSAPLMTREIVLPLPASAKLKSIQPAAGAGLWMWIETAAGDQLWRLDASGQPVQKIMIETGAR